MKHRAIAALVFSTAMLFALPAAADIGLRGWGPRVGASDSPDQIVGGVHFDMGEFSRRVRFQPSFEIGFGDDVISAAGNFMVSYYFPVEGDFTPYAGGQLSAVFFDFDEGDGDSDTEIGPAGVGGFETRLDSGNRFLLELQVGFSDLPDMKLMAGWTFK